MGTYSECAHSEQQMAVLTSFSGFIFSLSLDILGQPYKCPYNY